MTAGELVSVEASAADPADEEPSAPALEVVFEDEHLVVVDKPAGLVTHPAPGHHGPTLAGALREKAAGGSDPRRAGIVHRLDRDTSGLLVVARSEAAYEALRREMKAREVRREYLALVNGQPDAESGSIDAPIGRDRARRTLVSTRSDRARRAVTHFEVLERLPRTALLNVRLETGRTHQIRAHLAAIGHPIAGDRRYGGGGELARALGLERPFLHAAALAFDHPVTPARVDREEPMPEDLVEALAHARSDLRP